MQNASDSNEKKSASIYLQASSRGLPVCVDGTTYTTMLTNVTPIGLQSQPTSFVLYTTNRSGTDNQAICTTQATINQAGCGTSTTADYSLTQNAVMHVDDTYLLQYIPVEVENVDTSALQSDFSSQHQQNTFHSYSHLLNGTYTTQNAVANVEIQNVIASGVVGSLNMVSQPSAIPAYTTALRPNIVDAQTTFVAEPSIVDVVTDVGPEKRNTTISHRIEQNSRLGDSATTQTHIDNEPIIVRVSAEFAKQIAAAKQREVAGSSRSGTVVYSSAPAPRTLQPQTAINSRSGSITATSSQRQAVITNRTTLQPAVAHESVIHNAPSTIWQPLSSRARVSASSSDRPARRDAADKKQALADTSRMSTIINSLIEKARTKRTFRAGARTDTSSIVNVQQRTRGADPETETRWKCLQCGVSCLSEAALRVHETVEHTATSVPVGTSPHRCVSCPLCARQFGRASALRCHVLAAHSHLLNDRRRTSTSQSQLQPRQQPQQAQLSTPRPFADAGANAGAEVETEENVDIYTDAMVEAEVEIEIDDNDKDWKVNRRAQASRRRSRLNSRLRKRILNLPTQAQTRADTDTRATTEASASQVTDSTKNAQMAQTDNRGNISQRLSAARIQFDTARRLRAAVLRSNAAGRRGVQRFKCAYCASSYSVVSALRLHTRRVHPFVPLQQLPHRVSCIRTAANKPDVSQKSDSRRAAAATLTSTSPDTDADRQASLDATADVSQLQTANGYACPFPNCRCVFRKLTTLNSHLTSKHVNQNAPKRAAISATAATTLAETQRPAGDSTIDASASATYVNNESCVSEKEQDQTSAAVAVAEDNVEAITITEVEAEPELQRNDASEAELPSLRLPINADEADQVTVFDPVSGAWCTQRLEVHDGVRYFVCRQADCAKRFKKPSDLLRHARIHTNERPFECEVCAKRFKLYHGMISHRRTHQRNALPPTASETHDSNVASNNVTDRKSHAPADECVKCPDCLRFFVSPRTLRVHHQTMHSNVNAKVCGTCSRRFRLRSQLLRHQFTKHGTPASQTVAMTASTPTSTQIQVQTQSPQNALGQADVAEPLISVQQRTNETNAQQFLTGDSLISTIFSGGSHEPLAAEPSLSAMFVEHANVPQVVTAAPATTTVGAAASASLIESFTTDFGGVELARVSSALFADDSNSASFRNVLRHAMTGVQPSDNVLQYNVGSCTLLPAHTDSHQDALAFSRAAVSTELQQLTGNSFVTNAVPAPLTFAAVSFGEDTPRSVEIVTTPVEATRKRRRAVSRSKQHEDELIKSVPELKLREPLVVTDYGVVSAQVARARSIRSRFVCRRPRAIDTSSSLADKRIAQNVSNVTASTDCRPSEIVFSDERTHSTGSHAGRTDADVEVCNTATQLELVAETHQPAAESQDIPITVQASDEAADGAERDVTTAYTSRLASRARPYKCAYCSRTFIKSSHLAQHHRSHTNERPFRCLVCLKSFVARSVLNAHIRTHSGVKSFRCSKCSCAFTTQSSLTRHTGTRHCDSRDFVCPYCRKTFKTFSTCKRHIKTHRRRLALQFLEKQQQAAALRSAVPIGETEATRAAGMSAAGQRLRSDLSLPTTAAGPGSSRSFMQPRLMSIGGTSQLQLPVNVARRKRILKTLPNRAATSTPNRLDLDLSHVHAAGVMSSSAAMQTQQIAGSGTQQYVSATVSGPSFIAATHVDLGLPSSATEFASNDRLNVTLAEGAGGTPLNLSALNLSSMSFAELGAATSNQDAAALLDAAATGCLVDQVGLAPLNMALRDSESAYADQLAQSTTFVSPPPPDVDMIVSTNVCNVSDSNEQQAAEAEEAADASRCLDLSVASRAFFKCALCANVYVRAAQLQAHVRERHADAKPFRCTRCSKHLAFAEYLELHNALVHSDADGTKKRPGAHLHPDVFSCTKCPLTFDSLASLIRHFRVHIDYRPFACARCERDRDRDRERERESNTAQSVNVAESGQNEVQSVLDGARSAGNETSFKTIQQLVHHCKEAHSFSSFFDSADTSAIDCGELVLTNTIPRGRRTYSALQREGRSKPLPLTPEAFHNTSRRNARAKWKATDFPKILLTESQLEQFSATLIGAALNSVAVSQPTAPSRSVLIDALSSAQQRTGGTRRRTRRRLVDNNSTLSVSEQALLETLQAQIERNKSKLASTSLESQHLPVLAPDTQQSPTVTGPSPNESADSSNLQREDPPVEADVTNRSRAEVEAELEPVETTAVAVSDKSIAQNQRVCLRVNGRPMYACTECGKSFGKPSDLARHARTHSGERPFICTLCDRRFAIKCTLDVHMRTHQRVRTKLRCHVCAALCSTKQALKTHMLLHVVVVRRCESCRLEFASDAQLHRHLAKYHQSVSSTENPAIAQNVAESSTNDSAKQVVSRKVRAKAASVNKHRDTSRRGVQRKQNAELTTAVVGASNVAMPSVPQAQAPAQPIFPVSTLKFVCEPCRLLFDTLAALQQHLGLVHSDSASINLPTQCRLVESFPAEIDVDGEIQRIAPAQL